jgi:hypothetical protein
LTFTPVSGSAQVTSGDPAVMPALTGVVTDTITNLPVVGAVVTLTDNQSLVYTTTSSINGAYTLSCALGHPMYTGAASVTAHAPGYNLAQGHNPAITINPGANTKHIQLTKDLPFHTSLPSVFR